MKQILIMNFRILVSLKGHEGLAKSELRVATYMYMYHLLADVSAVYARAYN